MEAWAIVVAAGSAVRFGQPKQYAALGGVRVVDLAVRGARASCHGVVLVVPPSDVAGVAVAGADAVVAGGASRSASVRAGLAAVPLSAEVIVVHDAARPLATAATWAAVLDAVSAGADGAIPGVAVSDTLKRVEGGVVVETLDRSRLVAIQTPQAFRADLLRGAHAAQGEATDDSALVEAAGGRVVVVAGDPVNVKLTTPGDLAFAEAMLSRQDPPVAQTTAAPGPPSGVRP